MFLLFVRYLLLSIEKRNFLKETLLSKELSFKIFSFNKYFCLL